MNFGFVMLCVPEDCEGSGRNDRADDKVIATTFETQSEFGNQAVGMIEPMIR